MRTSFLMGTFIAAAAASLLLACSGDGSSTFNQNAIDNPTFGGDAGGGGVLRNGGEGGVSNACATSSATPSLVPVSLVFIFDKSGSMSQNSKWPSCSQGLTSFFGDPASKGLSASLQFFPSGADQCNASGYASPAVPMTALPDGTSFANAIAANSPGGETPTLPALQGSLQYAQTVAAATPGTKSAIVLVTDGQPNVCGSSIGAVSNEAATAFSAGVPVFVIGIGNTGNLDMIASAGGTTKATIVSTSSPSATASDFQKALNVIRGQTLACEYAIPPIPGNATIDQVNVVYTPSGGSPETLTYDANCTMGGWHYDNVASPKTIVLCKSECDKVQADATGKVDIVFGCATQGGVPH